MILVYNLKKAPENLFYSMPQLQPLSNSSLSSSIITPASPDKMLLYDSFAVDPYVVRLFILERGGLSLDVQTVDIMALDNRKPPYRTEVNPRGELPALRLNDESSFVLTEITAICEYLDEVAKSGKSLYGETALQRAETRMWLRRMDLEIAQPVIEWYRNDPETIDFYKGNRIPTPEARVNQKVVINHFFNRLDEELEGQDVALWREVLGRGCPFLRAVELDDGEGGAVGALADAQECGCLLQEDG